MRFLTSTILAVALASTAVAGDAPPPAAPADLPVTAVTLYSSGVGAFEHGGTVQGDAQVELRFRAEQINDVLKSLVLQDLGGGQVGVIAYPSQDPVARTLKSFRLDLSGDPSLAQLLTQLRGAAVEVKHLDATLTGTVVGVEKRQRPVIDGKGVIDAWIVTLFTDGQLRQLPMEDIRGVKPLDGALRADLERALAALAQARDQEQKPVSISFKGPGARKVTLAYVAEAPLWKAGYRLLLAPAAPEKGKETLLQGWAIVENTTQSDWTDVRLALVSGRPISFIMDLYRPIYATRPTVQPELPPGVEPVAFGAGYRGAAKEKGDQGRELAAVRAPMAGAPMEMRDGRSASGKAATFDAAAADYAGSIHTQTESTQEFGALFSYEVGKVSIARGRSAMIPVVGSDIGCERVSIYNPTSLPRHPLSGVRLTNGTKLHLAPGPVTVYDQGSYAGDARLVATPPGTTRLLGFAVDQKILVETGAPDFGSSRRLVKIVRGVASLQVLNRAKRTYQFDHQGETETALIVEHPRTPGYDLKDPAKSLESTPEVHRFKLTAKPGALTFTVTEEHLAHEQFALFDVDSQQISVLLEGRDLSPKLREVLTKVQTLVAAVQAEIDAARIARDQVEAISRDQTRIRENLRSIPQGSDYARKLLEKLNGQESEIDRLRGEADRRDQAVLARRAELQQVVMAITVE